MESNAGAGQRPFTRKDHPSPAPNKARRKGTDPYDAIVWRLRSSEANQGTGFTLGVVGCGRRAGSTTVAANAAIRFADHGPGPVLLIESNFDHPNLARLFRLKADKGLGDVVAGRAEPIEAIYRTQVAGLDVMPLGGRGQLENAVSLDEKMSSLLAELRAEYTTIVIDLPPANRIAAAVPVARQVDAAILVIRSEATHRREAEKAVRELTLDGLPITGSVVTRRKRRLPRWLGGGI